MIFDTPELSGNNPFAKATTPMLPSMGQDSSNPFSPPPMTPQGAGSVPNAAPSPAVTQGAGTPPQPTAGVPSPQAAPQPQATTDQDPDAILAQMDAREQASQTGENDPDAILAQMDAREKQSTDETHSGLFNWGAGANKGLANLIAYPVRGITQASGLAQAGLGKAIQALGGKDFGATVEQAGLQMIRDAGNSENNADLHTIRTILDHLGGNTRGDENSMAFKIGENTTSAMANIMAIQAAAPTLAAKTGMGALTIIGRSMGEAALHNPWTAIVGEAVLGSPAATIAGEATDDNPTAAGLAGMAGNAAAQLVGSPVTRLVNVAAKYGVKLTTAMADTVLDTVNRITSKVSGNPLKNPAPIVPDDIIDAHRAAEQNARQAGEVVVQAASTFREAMKMGGTSHPASPLNAQEAAPIYAALATAEKARVSSINARQPTDDLDREIAGYKMQLNPPNTITGNPEANKAFILLQHAKSMEANANASADRAWMAIPEQVRNKYNQHSEAIRSEASDIMRPQVFAEEQLEGDRKLVTDRIQSALERVKPTEPGMTSEIYATRISEGLQEAEKMTSKMEGRLYNRVNMDKKLPDREGPLQDLADAAHEMRTKFEPDDIPIKAVQRLNDVFSAQDASGQPQALPTLQRIRAIMTSLGTERRQELALPSPNYQKVKNLSVLQTLGAKWLGEAFPDDIPLQQAREFSQFYHANFSNSDMLPFLRTTAQGGQRIRPEATLEEMFKRPYAFKDIYAAVNNVMDHPAFKGQVTITGPTMPIPSPNNPLKDFPTLGKLADTWGPQKPVDPNFDHTYGLEAGNYKAKGLSTNFPPGRFGDGKLFGPEDQARLGQLSSDLENGIRAQFQKELGDIISTPKTSTGALPDASEIALKQQGIVNKWGDRIKSFSGVAAEVQAAMQDALTGVQNRRAIEDSALAKYFETKDPQNAIQRVWSSANPAELARALMNGQAGVGGFLKDPAALEGFRAGLVDKLWAQTKGDPRTIIRTLAENPKLDRLMNVALGTDRMDRLNRITSNLVAMQDQAHNKWAEVLITGARLASLKVSAMLPKIGEGAELMQASIFSQTAKKAVQGILHKQPAEELLKDAIRNPNTERLLLGSQGGNWRGYTEAMRDMDRDRLMLRRVLRFGDGIIQAYNATQSNDQDGPGPVDHRPSLANSNIGSVR